MWKYARTVPGGKNYLVDYYNLYVAIAVGYRVKSPKLVKSIDFLHSHDGKQPHVHYDVYYKGTVTSPTSNDKIVIDKVNSWIKNRKK